jgi:hypothetical protein
MPIKIGFLESGATPDYTHLIFKRIEPEWPSLHYVILRLFEGAGLVASHRDQGDIIALVKLFHTLFLTST